MISVEVLGFVLQPQWPMRSLVQPSLVVPRFETSGFRVMLHAGRAPIRLGCPVAKDNNRFVWDVCGHP